jgi:hypothetical protein
VERFRPEGGGVGLPPLSPLDRPGEEGEVSLPLDRGLESGGDIDVVEGRS